MLNDNNPSSIFNYSHQSNKILEVIEISAVSDKES